MLKTIPRVSFGLGSSQPQPSDTTHPANLLSVLALPSPETHSHSQYLALNPAKVLRQALERRNSDRGIGDKKTTESASRVGFLYGE